MTCTECAWILRLVNWSMVFFAAPIVFWIGQRIYRKSKAGIATGYQIGKTGIALAFSIGFVASIFCLHYAVGCYKMHHPAEGEYVLNYGEEFFASLFRAARSFGLPEHYTEFVTDLRSALDGTLPADMAGATGWVIAFATVVNSALPIAGSALILGIFAKAFPRLVLRWKILNPWSRKCYFSGLNPQSLVLAKSILLEEKSKKKWLRPLIVFTDAYIDDEEEASYEMLLEAKRLGAVCVRDDMIHVAKARMGEYYLMEEDEYANVPTLMGLLEKRNARYVAASTIYLFVQSDIFERVEESICAKLMAEYGMSSAMLPKIMPINTHRNLVQKLMVDVPLFEPLVGTDKTELNVTILGSGSIGTEAFVNAYWFGQVLGKDAQPCQLNIHVVSQEEKERFYSKIDFLNPEILRTSEIRNTAATEDALRQWNEHMSDPQTRPYAKVSYHTADVKSGDLGRQADWLQSDYFIVALGCDADNIAVAEKLRNIIGKDCTESKTLARKAVIAYVVYDTALCHTMNILRQIDAGIYMHAFGSMDEVYSSAATFMSHEHVLAKLTGSAYQQYSGRQSMGLAAEFQNSRHFGDNPKLNTGEYKEEQNKRKKAKYNYASNYARAMHVYYKIFSLGWIQTSLFDDEEKHEEEMKRLYRRYVRIGGLHEACLTKEDRDHRDEWMAKRERLAWLEHRRWNAAIRTMGYCYSTQKDFILKLHPCLVETREPHDSLSYAYLSDLDAYYGNEKATQSAYQEGLLDKLDIFSVAAGYDCKVYDYPELDVGDFVTVSQVMEMNRNADGTLKVPALTETVLNQHCKENADSGAFREETSDGEQWIVPRAYLQSWLGREYLNLTGEKS